MRRHWKAWPLTLATIIAAELGCAASKHEAPEAEGGRAGTKSATPADDAQAGTHGTVPSGGQTGTHADGSGATGAANGTGMHGGAGQATGSASSRAGGRWPDLGDATAPEHTAPEATNQGPVTLGGTLTFVNIGAPGYWGRRIEAEPGDPRCDVQAETINYPWGGNDFCCRTKHVVTSDRITPFNEQLTLVLDGPMRITQLAVYQPLADVMGPWAIRSYWDRRAHAQPFNLHFSGPDKQTVFAGDLGNNCSFFAMQERPFPCGAGSEPYCPGSALDYYGWAGSKLFVLLASMPYADDPSFDVSTCIEADQSEREQDSPWIGVAPSELNRDGWSGYHPCHCFANTDAAVGDGCGQINVFEVVAEASGVKWGNRDIISTGIRSYQVGSLGGATCGLQGCSIEQFPINADLLDANSLNALAHGVQIDADHRQMAEGPVWRRATDDRYYLALLDENTRTVQVMILHPANLPAAAAALLPTLPNEVSRGVIDTLVTLRVP